MKTIGRLWIWVVNLAQGNLRGKSAILLLALKCLNEKTIEDMGVKF